jgi:hypothetical protein
MSESKGSHAAELTVCTGRACHVLLLQEQCQKLRDERETAMRDLARLRCDCEAGNAERDRLAAELKEVKDELDK